MLKLMKKSIDCLVVVISSQNYKAKVWTFTSCWSKI